MRTAPGIRRGFSLIEVILSIGVLAIAIVALLGLIGPTLGAVKTVLDTNAGVSAISKMNTILDTTPFYDGANVSTRSASVYTWIANSTNAEPTAFFFFNELDTISGNITPLVAVTGAVELPGQVNGGTTPAPGTNITTVVPFSTLVSDAQLAGTKSIDGPVIAMTLSISPMAQEATNGGTFPTGENYYTAPSTGVFPSPNSLPTSPNTTAATGLTLSYPEAYLPILVQVFSVRVDQLSLGAVDAAAPNLPTLLTDANRIFTYTTAKLR